MPAYIPRAARNDWRTPPDVVALVRQAFGGQIDLDPCAGADLTHGELLARQNMRLLEPVPGFDTIPIAIQVDEWNVWIQQTHDALSELWSGKVFVNPPFADNAKWVAKCIATAESNPDNEVILLIPARTDTRYWHAAVETCTAICFWKGRMRFVGAPSSAPFPTALIYWGGPFGAQRFFDAFRDRGHVVACGSGARYGVAA